MTRNELVSDGASIALTCNSQIPVGRAILLVDTDLRFLFWLGSALDHAGYNAFPARTVSDAIALLRELHLMVEVLMVNCALPGAADLIARVRFSQKRLKVISLVEEELPVLTAGVDAVCTKPVETNERAKGQLVRFVEQVASADSMAF